MYGVIAFHVTSRTHEITIRMAIVAKPGDVFRLVIGQGLKATLVGVAFGLALMAAVSRLLASLLYGVSSTDPVTWISATGVWLALALIACWLPARRASGVEPAVALRQE
jgi:putative ABC transport system permease protein